MCNIPDEIIYFFQLVNYANAHEWILINTFGDLVAASRYIDYIHGMYEEDQLEEFWNQYVDYAEEW